MIELEDFKDPDNKDEILSKISLIRNPEMAYEFALSIKDKNSSELWIEDEIDKFVSNLEPFNENWKKLSLMFGQIPKKILKVRKVCLQADNEFIIIRAISEILTRCGYCVRGEEIVRCSKCDLGMIYNQDCIECNNCQTFEILE
jgi:hypothetical protein